MPRHDIYHLVDKVFNDRFRIDEFKAEGGMALVYLATDLVLNRPVGLKILHPRYEATKIQASYYLELFQRETGILGKLNHPNIVELIGSGFEDNYTFFAMEWLEGQTLSSRITQAAPLSLHETAIILKKICSGLNATHSQGIVHLDLKPDNVFLVNTPGGVELKIIDFGLSRIVQSTMGSTLSRVIGTPHYIAPEIYRGLASPYSDIYSLGIMSFEMLTGRLPFSSTGLWAIMNDHISAQPPSLARSDVSEGMKELLSRSLDKEPRMRPLADEFIKEFLRCAVPKKCTKFGKVGPLSAVSENASKPETLNFGETSYLSPLRYEASVRTEAAVIGISLLSCSAVLFGSYLFVFPESMVQLALPRWASVLLAYIIPLLSFIFLVKLPKLLVRDFVVKMGIIFWIPAMIITIPVVLALLIVAIAIFAVVATLVNALSTFGHKKEPNQR